MKRCARFLLVAAVICLAAEAWAVNSVVVESKQVALNATGVTVGAYVTNDVTVTGMIIILELREITPGSFTANTFNLTIQGRVAASGLMDFPSMRYLGTPAANTCSGPVSNTYSTTSPVDFISPDALEWAGAQMTGPRLAAGTDGSPGSGTPSFLLTFDVTGIEGWFEIDTCCTTPANHLIFVDNLYNPVSPSFQKGTVTIGNPQPNDPPVAVCAPLITGTDPGTCERASVDAAQIDGGSYDPDGDAITFRVNPLGPYPLGVTDVWLVVEDDPGDKDSCQTTITVEDDEPPTAICPTDITREVAFGETGAFVSFIIDADDNCPGVIVSANPASGSFFPIGMTPVEVTATDASGNPNTCFFSVTVNAAPPCNERPVDVNCDGVVDVLDVVTVVNTAFRSVPEPGSCCAGGP